MSEPVASALIPRTLFNCPSTAGLSMSAVVAVNERSPAPVVVTVVVEVVHAAPVVELNAAPATHPALQ